MSSEKGNCDYDAPVAVNHKQQLNDYKSHEEASEYLEVDCPVIFSESHWLGQYIVT